MILRALATVFALHACAAASPLYAQPAPPDARTGGILVSDTNLDAIYLVRDLDNDGTANSPGEVTIFFGPGNASGLPAPTGLVQGIFQTFDRTVYIGDGDTDTVYALRDNNADGDAMDPGEARVWFRGGVFNHLNFLLETPTGIASHGGAIFIVNAAVGANPDAIYRTVDLNGDGDANDEDECTIWFDLATHVATSSAFDMCFVGDSAFVADLRGGSPDVILRLRDADGMNGVDAGEFNIYLADGTEGAACDFSCVTDGVDVFVHNLSGVQTIFRLRDVNTSGDIDAAGEAVPVWSESALPAGSVVQTSNAIAHGPVAPVRTMAISSHGTGVQDGLFLLHDLNDSGDFTDEDETVAFVIGVAADGVFPENIRALCFYAPTCRADFDRNGLREVPDIFAYLTAWFAGSPEADIDGVGGVQVPDIFAFLSLWFAGC